MVKWRDWNQYVSWLEDETLSDKEVKKRIKESIDYKTTCRFCYSLNNSKNTLTTEEKPDNCPLFPYKWLIVDNDKYIQSCVYIIDDCGGGHYSIVMCYALGFNRKWFLRKVSEGERITREDVLESAKFIADIINSSSEGYMEDD